MRMKKITFFLFSFLHRASPTDVRHPRSRPPSPPPTPKRRIPTTAPNIPAPIPVSFLPITNPTHHPRHVPVTFTPRHLPMVAAAATTIPNPLPPHPPSTANTSRPTSPTCPSHSTSPFSSSWRSPARPSRWSIRAAAPLRCTSRSSPNNSSSFSTNKSPLKSHFLWGERTPRSGRETSSVTSATRPTTRAPTSRRMCARTPGRSRMCVTVRAVTSGLRGATSSVATGGRTRTSGTLRVSTAGSGLCGRTICGNTWSATRRPRPVPQSRALYSARPICRRSTRCRAWLVDWLMEWCMESLNWLIDWMDWTFQWNRSIDRLIDWMRWNGATNTSGAFLKNSLLFLLYICLFYYFLYMQYSYIWERKRIVFILFVVCCLIFFRFFVVFFD